MPRALLFIVALSAYCLCLPAFSQSTPKKIKATGNEKQADEYFRNEDYNAALGEYLILVTKKSNIEKYNYRIGICYLNTDIDKPQALTYLNKIKALSSETEIKYMIGRAYMYNYKFDEAIQLFNEYISERKGNKENLADAVQEVQYCNNAKELMKFPLNIEFENMGKDINSEYPDYFPFIPEDESFLIYNSKRPLSGALQYADGSWSAGVYISKVKDGQFTKTKPMGRVINSLTGDEEAVGLSAGGDYLLLYFNNMEGQGDLYISKSDKSKNFKEPMILDKQINSEKGQEISASITSDANTIYFASTRPGGLGGSDIYACRRLPNNSWGPAQNLGPEINTPYNEDFPTISPDGKLLFFSSMGHTGMGGYDIFVAKYDSANNTFNGIKNIGYPINTPEDNMNFRLSSSGKYGYISACRKEGLGDLDIYRVNFLDVDPFYSVITGKIKSASPSVVVDSSHISIMVINSQSHESAGEYTPNRSTGNYVIALPPGKYELHVEVPGFRKYFEIFFILGKNAYKPMIEKNIVLIPEGGTSPASPNPQK